MKQYLIKGGKKLCGRVKIESAKNSVLPILAACALTDREVIIKNCPKISDVMGMLEILTFLGAKTEFWGDNLLVCCKDIKNKRIPCCLTGELRSSVFMLGPLVARFNKAELSLPGGCNIGSRPIDLHISGLETLGAVSFCSVDGVFCDGSKMHPGTVKLKYPSVGATENIVMASVFLNGKTILLNAAKEPEIVDLVMFLKKIGAKIVGEGTERIEITGVNSLTGGEYLPFPDRIEAGTFAALGLMCGGKIDFENAGEENFSFFKNKFLNNSCKIYRSNDIITLIKIRRCTGFDLITAPYPGFPTDMQAQLLALATVADGTSHITETVFESRFSHVKELIKTGAKISLKENTATVTGVEELHGATLYAGDLRGGAALTLAALTAKGESRIFGVEHIERGYLNFDKKLSSLGAEITVKK